MKYLEVNCKCGASMTATGADVDDIICEIDALGWQEIPPEPGAPKGSVDGVCPDCQPDDDSHLGEPD
jgi:hypothetical protein